MLLWMGSSQTGSVKRDELGFTALWRRPLWRRLLGHWGLLLGRAARGCHLWGGNTWTMGLSSLPRPQPPHPIPAPLQNTPHPSLALVLRPLEPTLPTPCPLPVPSRAQTPGVPDSCLWT